MDYEFKIKELKIILPKAADPVGSYVATKISGNLLFVSGQVSIDENGNCLDSCHYDPTNDGNIDIFDIIFLVSNFLIIVSLCLFESHKIEY